MFSRVGYTIKVHRTLQGCCWWTEMGYTHKTDLTFALFFWWKCKKTAKMWVQDSVSIFALIGTSICAVVRVSVIVCFCCYVCESISRASRRLDLNKYLVSCELWGSSLLTDDIASGFTGTRWRGCHKSQRSLPQGLVKGMKLSQALTFLDGSCFLFASDWCCTISKSYVENEDLFRLQDKQIL